MQFTNEIIGGKLLESITGGLYDGNLNCIREYVQNSIDSGAKNIKIYFELGNRDLIIRDDGSGMTKEELRLALNIGVSNKTVNDIGWRGIGIWSGVPASKELVIITKSKGHQKLRIRIDNERLRNEFESNRPILDILTKSTGEIEELPLGKSDSIDDHYTEIRLENILITQKHKFNEREIYKYLQLVIPAPFNKQDFSFAAEIDEWLRHCGVIFPDVNIEFNGEKIYRPPYNTDPYINVVIKHPFFDKNNNMIAVAWILSLSANEAKKWPKAGILFKKKGFTIGDENLVRSYFTETYHQWHYGEVHIISNKIRENAPRNNFEYNPGDIQELITNMKLFISNLELVHHGKSSRMDTGKMEKIDSSIAKGDIETARQIIRTQIARISKKPRKFPANIYFEPLTKKIVEFSEQNTNKLLSLNEMSDHDLSKHHGFIKDESSKFGGMVKDESSKFGGMVKDESSKFGGMVKDESLKSDEMIKKDLEIEEETFKIKRSDLNGMIDAFLPKSAANDLKKLNKGGKLDIEVATTDILKTILQDKTGLKSNEIETLSKAAFAWGKIPKDGKPILQFDKHRQDRDLRLGVLIYAVYDIFVNKYKHDRGSGHFKWFDNATDDEKLKIIYGHVAIICLIYRLIESCEKSKP